MKHAVKTALFAALFASMILVFIGCPNGFAGNDDNNGNGGGEITATGNLNSLKTLFGNNFLTDNGEETRRAAQPLTKPFYVEKIDEFMMVPRSVNNNTYIGYGVYSGLNKQFSNTVTKTDPYNFYKEITSADMGKTGKEDVIIVFYEDRKLWVDIFRNIATGANVSMSQVETKKRLGAVDFDLPDFDSKYNGIPKMQEATLASNGNNLESVKTEYISTLFDVVMGDMNNDEVPDFIVSWHQTLYVFDGETFALLHEKKLAEGDGQFYIRAVVVDLNDNGENDLIVSESGNNGRGTLYYFQDVKTNGLAAAKFKRSHPDIKAVGICIDKTSGKQPDLYLGGTYHSGNDNSRDFYQLKTNENNGIDGEFTKIGNFGYDTAEGRLSFGLFTPVVCAKLYGRNGPTYLVTPKKVFWYDGSWKESNDHILNYDVAGAPRDFTIYGDQLIAGNFDGNDEGRDYVAYGLIQSTYDHPNYYDWNRNLYYKIAWPTDSINFWERNPICEVAFKDAPVVKPNIGSGNVNQDSLLLQYTGDNYRTYSEPFIVATLCAPPYFRENGVGGGSTVYKKSNSSSNENEITNTINAKVITGFNFEQSVPVFGTKLTETDVTATIGGGYTHGYGNAVKKEFTTSWGVSDSDGVVVSAIAYDSFDYKILNAPEKALIGKVTTQSVPKGIQTQLISIDKYNAAVSENKRLTKTNVLSHTIGEPFTYKNFGDNFSTGDSMEDKNKFLFESDGIGVGNAGTSGQEITTEWESSTSDQANCEINLEVFTVIGVVKIGAGVQYQHTNSVTYTVGKGQTASGFVQSIPEGSPADKYFTWKLAWYKYNLGGNEFPVVTYKVQTK